MSGQVQTAAACTEAPSEQRLDAWVSFLRAHAAITRELSVRLQREHGLTLNDYEVLLHLARAEGGMMRRVDLAQSVLLTASGITRLLDGLERAGLVEKASCERDARVSYAKVTDAGRAKLSDSGRDHLRDIEELFSGNYSGSELATLADLLSRLPTTGDDCRSSCTAS
jgi:DNA-binding MarR family transcriptional regulator